MFVLTADAVRMNAHATSKKDALSLLAQTLTQDGLTTDAYLQGLLDRESQSSTYLGQGIAIPHGTPASRDAILQTGIRLVHFADGVVWNDAGDKVHLAVVIAAKSDEHLQILQQLTRTLNNDVADAIKNAKTADEIVQILNNKQAFILNETLVKSSSLDDDEQLLEALKSLKSAGALSSLLMPTHQPTALSRAVKCIVLENQPQILQSALALMINPKAKEALAVVVANASVDTDKLSSIYDVLLSDELSQAVMANQKEQVLSLLGIETVADWQSMSVVIGNEHGLHARPATALSELAKQASEEIRVRVEQGAYVSAKSLTRLLSLGATHGQTLTFIAKPNTDAAALLPKIIEAVKNGLGETVKSQNQTATAEKAKDSTIALGQKTKAIAASTGMSVGEAFVSQVVRYQYPMTAQNPQEQMQNLLAAIDGVKADLRDLVANAKKADIAQIFTAHIALLEDEEVVFGAKDSIDDGLSAPAAWHAFIEELAKTQASLSNHTLAERAADLKDVGQRVLLKLLGEKPAEAPTDPYVLIKEDLVPSDVASLDPTRVAAIITAVGGSSSHSAIIARALGIPALVGAGRAVLDVQNGTKVLVDGTEGWFVVEPEQSLIDACQETQAIRREQKRQAMQHAHEPAITLDGHRIEVAANLGNVADTAGAVANGAEGIGLLRTELVFMSHQQVPDIQTQIADYEQVFDALEGRPLVVRVLDIGGDKALPYLPMTAEENPFLGLRGIRLLLERPELLRSQLTALIQASKGRDLRIMFPMIGRVEEYRAARAILDEILAEYPHDNLQVGIMLEVPSAAVMAPIFAKEVDFFSIGTNDLTQYVLAIDRGHPLLSKDADGLHPSILMLIHQTVQAAHAHGKWVGVCGELASDAAALPILVGLGVDELSMSSTSIALAKAQIRNLNLSDAQALAQKALLCDTAAAVRELSVA